MFHSNKFYFFVKIGIGVVLFNNVIYSTKTTFPNIDLFISHTEEDKNNSESGKT